MFHQVLVVDFCFACGGLFRKLLCTDFSSESCWVNMFLPFFCYRFLLKFVWHGFFFREILVKYMSSSKMFCLKCLQTFFG